MGAHGARARGWARALGARHGTGVQACGAGAYKQAGAGARRQAGAWGASGRRAGHGLLGGLGVLLGQRAVHSVHSACFWPDLTQYFSRVIFLDIVREPGS